MKRKRVGVLGATGSIGKSTIEVLRNAKDDFEPVLFSAHNNIEGLLALADEFHNSKIVLSGANSVCSCRHQKRLYAGRNGLFRAIEESGADIFVHGISGSAGLEVSLAVLESGADLALANKESVVMAWNLIKNQAVKKNANIIPVDSEHSAVFNLISAHCNETHENLSEIILTASGGPFYDYTKEALMMVTVEEALAHPTWNMGVKITIDSATLANKGLEVIEASRLFDVPPERITVTVHRQSIVHSMIRTACGAVYAEMSLPDMRFPIHNALYYPAHRPCIFAHLDFGSGSNLNLSFGKPDYERFPMLSLAYEACRAGALYTVVYNAANEEAVALFVNRRIGFTQIPYITENVLTKDWSGGADSLETILAADSRARALALEYVR
jgi:1-deoxy-D-xylulose-5-phosphate reductoisomerase